MRGILRLLTGASVVVLGALLLFAVLLQSDRAIGLAYRARRLEAFGKFQEALPLLDRAIEIDPRYAANYIDRGWTNLELENYDSALTDLNKAISLNPHSAPAFNDRCALNLRLHKEDLAVQDCSKSIALDRKLVLPLTNRAIAYHANNKFDLAELDIKAALSIDPRNATAFALQGMSYLHDNQPDLAKNAFDETNRLNPDNPLARFGDAQIEGQKGHYGAAINQLNSLIADNQKAPAMHDFRGRLHFYQGAFQAAADDLQVAVRESPLNPYFVLWLYLARQHTDHNDSAEFANNANKLTGKAWPWPVIEFYEHKISADQLQAAVDSSDPDKKNAQTCEADFYIGEIDVFEKSADKAKDHFAAAVDICPSDFIERFGALAELNNFKPQ